MDGPHPHCHDDIPGHPEVAHRIQEVGADYRLAFKANDKEAHQGGIAQFALLRP